MDLKETFRTAPVQLGAVASNVLIAATCSFIASEKSTPENIVILAGAAINVGYIALNLKAANSQISLRDRVEKVLERDGFDERYMEKTLPTYCGRQATIVACENTGFQDEYAELRAKHNDESDKNWLPHI